MKYRIVQYLEKQYEYTDGFKFKPISEYRYVAQYRYNWWPFWHDMCFPKDTKEEAQKFIDADIKERNMPKVIIHDINYDNK